MKKITLNDFNDKVKNILIDGTIPSIEEKDVTEFKIGKNYFYKLTENHNLKNTQKYFNDFFQKEVSLNNSAIAFRKKFSYFHLFEPHRKNYFFLRLDIKSFFHSINEKDIKNTLKEYFDDAYIGNSKEQSLIDAFLNIIMYKIPETSNNEKFKNKRVLPIGFITSPVISNIIFRKLDIQIQKFCSQKNIKYTRYADDMFFSSKKSTTFIHSNDFEKEIRILLSQFNFKLNNKKTIKEKHTISLNGYTIQHSIFEDNIDSLFETKKEIITNELKLSNKKLYLIKKFIYTLLKNKMSHKKILKKLFNYELPYSVAPNKEKLFYKHQIINKLVGYRSFLLSIIVFNKKYNCCKSETISRYQFIIEQLNRLIKKY